MAASVAPAPSFPQSDASTVVVVPSSSEFDTLPTGNYATSAHAHSSDKDLFGDIYSTPIYRRLHKIGIVIGLVTTIRVAILAFLFCAWSLRSFMFLLYPDKYDPSHLYYENLDLENLIMPVEVSDVWFFRYPLACIFFIDTLVCLSTALVCSFVKNLPRIVLLCTLWFCFMLFTLAVYVLGTVMNIYYENYQTLLYLHLILVPITMILLILNVMWLRSLVKMGYKSFPKPNASGVVKKSKKTHGIDTHQQGQEHQGTYDMAMDNEGMYNNIFGETGSTEATSSGAYPSQDPYSNTSSYLKKDPYSSSSAYPNVATNQSQSTTVTSENPSSTLNQNNAGTPTDTSTHQTPAAAAAAAYPAATSSAPEPYTQTPTSYADPRGPTPAPATYNQYYYQQPTNPYNNPQNQQSAYGSPQYQQSAYGSPQYQPTSYSADPGYSQYYPPRYEMDAPKHRMSRILSTPTSVTPKRTPSTPQLTERRKSREHKKHKEKKKKDKKHKKHKKHKS